MTEIVIGVGLFSAWTFILYRKWRKWSTEQKYWQSELEAMRNDAAIRLQNRCKPVYGSGNSSPWLDLERRAQAPEAKQRSDSSTLP